MADPSSQENNLSHSSIMKAIISGGIGMFMLKVSGMGFSFFIALVLARTLGATDYGVYSYAMAWMTLLATITLIGMDKLLIRHIAVYNTNSDWGLMRGLLRWSHLSVLLLSLIVILVSGVVILSVGQDSSQIVIASLLMLIAIPFVSLNRLRRATMQSLHRVILGQIPEAVIHPFLFLTLVISSYFFLKDHLSAPFIVGLNVIAIFIAFLAGTWFLNKSLPRPVKDAIPHYNKRTWMRILVPLMIISYLYAINTEADTILLGMLSNAKQVGLYKIANKLASLVMFPLIAINAVLSPEIARLYSQGETLKLQRIITKSVRIMFILSFPLVLLFVFSGDMILKIFGSEFTEGSRVLAILSIGHAINVFTGPVGILLIMTGHEQQAMIGLGISSFLNISLNILLIPIWGIEGAAYATTASLILWNIILLITVKKRLAINPTALGVLGIK